MAKILLLESDKVLADNLGRFLRARKHRVIWSAGPQEAIENADKHQPEIIIMDLVLGGHGGIEFLYELRSYPEWQDLPVIILSSMSREELSGVHTGLDDLNITEFYYKPQISLAKIAAAVGTALHPQKVPMESEARSTG